MAVPEKLGSGLSARNLIVCSRMLLYPSSPLKGVQKRVVITEYMRVPSLGEQYS